MTQKQISLIKQAAALYKCETPEQAVIKVLVLDNNKLKRDMAKLELEIAQLKRTNGQG